MSKQSCRICGILKPLADFYFRKDSGKYRSECKGCFDARSKAWSLKNPKRRKEIAIKYSRGNSDKKREWKRSNRAASKKWDRENPERMREMKRKWKKRNPDKVCADSMRRITLRLNATPAWANKLFISEAYHLARIRSELTGVKWHVDHIVPLRSELVCGLHCEANLAVIQAAQNFEKSNRRWPDMP